MRKLYPVILLLACVSSKADREIRLESIESVPGANLITFSETTSGAVKKIIVNDNDGMATLAALQKRIVHIIDPQKTGQIPGTANLKRVIYTMLTALSTSYRNAHQTALKESNRTEGHTKYIDGLMDINFLLASMKSSFDGKEADISVEHLKELGVILERYAGKHVYSVETRDGKTNRVLSKEDGVDLVKGLMGGLFSERFPHFLIENPALNPKTSYGFADDQTFESIARQALNGPQPVGSLSNPRSTEDNSSRDRTSIWVTPNFPGFRDTPTRRSEPSHGPSNPAPQSDDSTYSRNRNGAMLPSKR